jgi:hypothetical protein
MRRTDFCLLNSSYEHPRLVGSRMSRALFTRACPRDRLVHASAIRFGGPHVRPLSEHRPRWALSSQSWSVRFPHLWHPCRLLRESRDARAPLDSSKVAETASPRPRETRCAAERSEVSSVVQGPSPRDALSGARLRTLPVQWLGHRCSGSRRLFTCPSSPGMSGRARPPFTRTVANGGRAYPGHSTPLADFCNLSRYAGTPFERPILARERSFRPAARRHQPMPVALVPRCVAASRTCEPRSARDGLRRRVPLAWTSRTAGRSAGVKAVARSSNDSRGPSSLTPRAPESPARFFAKSGELRASSLRPRPTSEASSRKETSLGGSGCLLPRRNPYASAGANPYVRARTGAPSRRLVERHCSGALSRLCYRFRTAFL